MADASARRTAPSIAVVGLGCRFPDADDPVGLLDAALTGRRAFRRLPPDRFSLADYHRPDAASDATYSTRAALIEGWQFDCAAFGVEPYVYAASDPAHWLALETASRALATAGLPAGTGLHRDRTGVIIGNTLAGDTSRANSLRLRWPYVRRTLTEALGAADLQADTTEAVLRHAERRYLTPFPAMGPYTLAGSIPATIAATISAYFGFRGGSHAIDSACSSSLQAVASACVSLAAGDLDAALAGGVDLSLDPLKLIGLAQARMLALADVRLYDQNPSGYLPGEGCGILVLMRAADARAADLPVYAEIVGWGTSSGGLPGDQPSQTSSLLLAMRRAYDRAGVDPAEIHYIEGNGAATPADDAAELRALASLRNGATHPAALGSVKANIGHAGAAAGAAGLIKTVLAASTGVVPPTTGVDKPHDFITGGHAAVTLPEVPREWTAKRRLAAVSTTGIGGSNVHLVLRHDAAARTRAPRWTRPTPTEPDAVEARLARAAEPLPFLLHAPDRAALGASLSRLAERAEWLSDAELLDLACALGRDPDPQGPARVALLATRQEELAALAREALTMLPQLADGLIGTRSGIFASDGADGRVTLLLSGNEPAELADESSDALRRDVGHCLDMLRWLDTLEVCATAAVGHGLATLAGLAWAGVLGEREVVEIVQLRTRFLTQANGRGATSADADSWPPRDRNEATALRGAIARRFRFGPPRRRLISTVTGAEVESVDDAIDLICYGFTGPDKVADAVKTGTVGATLLLDTGPGQTLAEAVSDVRVPAQSLRSGLSDRANSATVAAALFAAGAVGDAKPLFAGLQTRPIDIAREHTFLASPCEVQPQPQIQPKPQPQPQPEPPAGTAQPRRVEPAEGPDISPVTAAARTSKKPATGGDGNRSRDDVHAQSRRKSQPIAGIRPWARCFTEGLRPVQPPTAATPTRTWRVFSSARDQRLTNLGRQFTADPSAQRTLAIIEDPADELSRTTALAAAQDAVGRGELVVLTTSAAFASFFATLHAEHPSMGVTVLRVSPETASLAAVLPFAIATPGRFRELVVTGDGEVNEPVLAEVPVPGGGELPLGPDDTIVISRETGGAGLVLAQVLSCAGTNVVVVGQAEAGHDTRLIAGLEELRAAGARIAYEAIDISDAASLADAMSRIEDRLGPVTAIAHGVSQGDPVPVIKITNEDIDSLAASPAGTLQRLVESVGAGQLKLLISVGTVAGRYGLPGAGVHTLDRGALASRAAEIAAAQPDCQHVHLDQPAWTARGLGERPKLVNQLAAADTPPIGLAAASRLLLRAFSTPGRPASIAVHGRVGGLARRPAPTISSEELAAAGMPKGGRFLRQVAVHYPGIELICAARISLASDPYLADYRIDGLPALPPVVALEALAQAASVLAGRPVRQAMSVRFDTPAVIPEGGAAMLRVCAQRDGDTVIAVLRCSQSSYRVDHAAATFSCEQAGMPDSPVAVGSSAVPPLVSAAATGLVDGAELYGPVCFQAGPFRRIALLPEITPRSGRAIARGADEQPWFATGGTLDSASFLLGSPGLNDAVLQVLQACVPHRRIRLVSCESVQFAGRDVTGPVEIRAIAGPIRPADRADRADRADYADRPDRPGYADRPDHGNGAIGANGANGATSVSLSDGFNKVPLSELLNPAPPGAHRRPRQPGKLRTWRSTPPGQAGNGELDRRSRTAMGEATRSDLQVTRADAIRADSGPAGRQLWSVEAVNGAGQLLASWRGIRLADAGPLPRNSPWPPTLLAVFLERCAADLGLDAGLRVTISCGQPDVPTAAIPRQSVSTGDGLPDFRDRTASGRHAGPERRGINTVTARGTGQLAGFTLTARAPTPVSCAWVAVGDTNHRPHSAELTAVAHQFRAEFGEEPAVLEARLQAIRGCLAAADVQADSQLRVTHATSDGWATLATRRTRIVSTLVEVSGVAAPIAVALLTTRRAHARTAAANLPSTVPPR